MEIKPVKIEKDGETYDLHVMWSLHNKCNYSCSYCPPILHDGYYNWLKLEHLKGFVNRLEEHYVKNLGYKNILFSFTGGEPTLWPDFREFLAYINSKGFRIGLTTNAGVSVNYWKQVSTYFDYICMSFHAESADIDNFVKTFEYLHNADKTVVPSVRVMMHPREDLWDKCISVIEQIKKFPNYTYECVHILSSYGVNNIKVNYGSEEKEQYIQDNTFKFQFTDNSFIHKPEVGFSNKVTYSDGTSEKLVENELVNKDMAHFKGWDCNIGLEQLFIEFTGLIMRAGCFVGKELGTIADYENINFPTKPVKCTLPNCFCATDIRTTKYAPK
jgi:MoaA/NifB/PqqE/SkfB family radical SAM enzyme